MGREVSGDLDNKEQYPVVETELSMDVIPEHVLARFVQTDATVEAWVLGLECCGGGEESSSIANVRAQTVDMSLKFLPLPPLPVNQYRRRPACPR